MDVNEFSDRVRQEYNQLLETDESKEFEVSDELTDNVDVKFSGARKDSDRWGENNFALDARIDVTVEEEDDWEEVSGQVENFTESMKHLLNDTVGFTGPVIIRSSDDKCVRSWARRLIKQEEEKEE